MKSDFPEKLKLIRQHHNLTQVELAQLLHISRSHLSKLEAGILTPTSKLITAISSTFNLSTDWFLDSSPKELMIIDKTDLITDILIAKYSQLNPDYQAFVLAQIEQLITLQNKRFDKKSF